MTSLLKRFRTGPLIRWRAYWTQLANDYVGAVKEALVDAREHPIKALLYTSGAATLVYAWNTAPGRRDFDAQLSTAGGRLRMLPVERRRSSCERRLRRLEQLSVESRLRCWSLGPLSVLERRPFGDSVALPAARCQHLQPPISQLHRRLEDVGAFGVWWNLSRQMRDYDVSETEFPDDR